MDDRMKGTIEQLSKLIGVSYTTISRAINRPHLVQSATRKRIYEGMRRHRIFPNMSARNLKLGKRTMIGFVVSKSTNFFFLEYVHAFQMEAFNRGFLLVLHTYDPEKSPADIPFGTIPIDGMIAQIADNEDAFIEALCAQFVPVVIASNTAQTDFPVVASDDRVNMRSLAEHLIEQSPHSSIVLFATAPFNFSVEERIRGFSEALAAHGRSDENSVHRFGTLEAMYASIETMKKNAALPGIIMAQNDFTAVKVILALAQRGIHVPDDVIVSGYDNVAIVREMAISFPTIDTRLAEQARKVFDIFDRHKMKRSAEKHLIPGTIIV